MLDKPGVASTGKGLVAEARFLDRCFASSGAYALSSVAPAAGRDSKIVAAIPVLLL